jgi:hypothetical protein
LPTPYTTIGLSASALKLQAEVARSASVAHVTAVVS